MKVIMAVMTALLLAGCTIPNWPGAGRGYGYPTDYGYGYGYPGYGYNGFGNWGYRGNSYYGYGPGFGYDRYNQAREEDWRRWQAYQYGLSQGQQQAHKPGQNGPPGSGYSGADRPQARRPAPAGPTLPYGITQNRGGTYHVPGYGNVTGGQIQHYMRKKGR